MNATTVPTIVAVTSVLALCMARPSRAQDQPRSDELQAECHTAADAVRAARAGSERATQLHRLVGCTAQSGSIVPGIWRNRPVQSDELNWLVAASVATRDYRIYNATNEIAQDPNAPLSARIAALRVLANYGDPRVWVSLEDIASRRAIVLPITDHPLGRSGPVALPADVRERVLATFARLSGDTNVAIRDAALFLSRAFPKQ